MFGSAVVRIVPIVVIVLALAAFGRIGGLVAVALIMAGLVAWAVRHVEA